MKTPPRVTSPGFVKIGFLWPGKEWQADYLYEYLSTIPPAEPGGIAVLAASSVGRVQVPSEKCDRPLPCVSRCSPARLKQIELVPGTRVQYYLPRFLVAAGKLLYPLCVRHK